MPELEVVGSEDRAIWIVKSSVPNCSVKGPTSIVIKAGESKFVAARNFKSAPLISYTVYLHIIKGERILHSTPSSIPFVKYKKIIFDIDRPFDNIRYVRFTWFDYTLRFFGLSVLQKLFDKMGRKPQLTPSSSPPNTSSQSIDQHLLLLSPSTESKTPAQTMDEKSVPDAHFIEGESNNGSLNKSLSSSSFASFHSCECDSPDKDAPNENSHEVGVESKLGGLLKNFVGANL